MKKLNKKGFTLIELIVVIAILAILAAILIPAITGYIARATNAKEQANCRSLYAETSMELMLNSNVEDYVPTIGAAAAAHTVGDLSITWTVGADASIVGSFECVGSNQTFTSPDFAGVAN